MVIKFTCCPKKNKKIKTNLIKPLSFHLNVYIKIHFLETYATIDGIVNMAKQLESIEQLLCSRNCNKVAHSVASFDNRISGLHRWMIGSPGWFSPILKMV